ncbi:metallophosphatase family protein [ANME-2 cluster archaeon]|nr:MAG: metallophosphatase family protein [ANME-2 cluster archaeon]
MARLIISDLHADLHALDTIIAIVNSQAFIDRYGETTTIINLGDVVERGYHPVEVIEQILALKDEMSVVSVIGDHDEAFLFDREISGSDPASIRAHSALRENKRCMRFFDGLPQYLADYNDRILAVHGGPIDPSTIEKKVVSDDWLYQRTWQRISETGDDFFDLSGYHYRPEHAFAYVKETFGRGFLILCGHEHFEACYLEIDEGARNIINGMIRRKEVFSGSVVHVKAMMRQKGVNYLVRVGIAGPEGYARFGENRSHFGLLWEHKGMDWIGLFSFVL